MQTTQALANPFALLMEPEAVFASIEKSGRLDGLQRRICRPLDKPLIPHTASDADAMDLDELDDLDRLDDIDSDQADDGLI